MKNVVIIGAGPAGLTAAYELLKDNKGEYNVVIVEKDKQVGGISKTIDYNGNKMDIGGHRFFSKNDEIMNFWSELMPLQNKNSYDDEKLQKIKPLPEDGLDPEENDNVLLIRNRVSRIYYNKKFFNYPIKLKLDTLKNMGFKKTFNVGFGYMKTLIKKKKEDSLENFYINRFGKPLYQMFFESYTEKLWGRHPKQISADWGAQRVKGISISAIIKDVFMSTFKIKNNSNAETSLIEQFWYPKYGPGELWETLAQKVIELGGEIKLNTEVKKINFESDNITSIVIKNNNQTQALNTDILISSMPIKDLINSFRNLEIPESILRIANGLPYRDFITVGVLAKKINLKNQTKIKTIGNIVPDCWIYVQEPDVKMCRIQIFNNWSPYLVKDIDNKIWMGLEYTCNENDELWNMSEKEFSDFAVNELIHMKILEKNDIEDTHVERIQKAYPAYFDTYDEFDKVREYLDTIHNLYCVGRNGQHRYNNMDHSMLTAIEAVNNIKNNLNSKNNIWSVNTEKEYHEMKK